MMKQLAASVPHVACEMNLLDSLSTKWRLYQADADIPPEWAETPNGHVVSVDEYCTGHGYQHRRMVWVINAKYNNMMVVVKAALYISHGQADVERGFSIIKHVVNKTRVTLKQHTISAIRTVRDVINKYKEVEQTDNLFMAFTWTLPL